MTKRKAKRKAQKKHSNETSLEASYSAELVGRLLHEQDVRSTAHTKELLIKVATSYIRLMDLLNYCREIDAFKWGLSAEGGKAIIETLKDRAVRMARLIVLIKNEEPKDGFPDPRFDRALQAADERLFAINQLAVDGKRDLLMALTALDVDIHKGLYEAMANSAVGAKKKDFRKFIAIEARELKKSDPKKTRNEIAATLVRRLRSSDLPKMEKEAYEAVAKREGKAIAQYIKECLDEYPDENQEK